MEPPHPHSLAMDTAWRARSITIVKEGDEAKVCENGPAGGVEEDVFRPAAQRQMRPTVTEAKEVCEGGAFHT